MLAHTTHYTVITIITVAMLFLLPPMAMAATYTVPGSYATISEAIANASGGDTITVDSGTSDMQSPPHVYKSIGSYTVSLTHWP